MAVTVAITTFTSGAVATKDVFENGNGISVTDSGNLFVHQDGHVVGTYATGKWINAWTDGDMVRSKGQD